MKLKNLIFFAGLCILAIGNTAFVNQPKEVETPIEVPEEVKVSFPKFLSHFEKVEMPFKVELGDLYKYLSQKVNTKSRKKGKMTSSVFGTVFMEYIPEQQFSMSRMGPPKIMPVARFYPNEKMIAVIYGVYNSFGSNRNLDFRMALYDLKGNLIKDDKSEESGYVESFPLARVHSQKTETFELTPDDHIWKKTYKNVYEKDLKKHGIVDNDIIAYELENTQVFKIDGQGSIQPTNEYPISDKASLD